MNKISDIAVFVEVVTSKSFTTAAERLNLSKSVISKYVTRLETRLGVRLLNRTTRRLSLTEAGQILYERSRLGLEEIESAESEVSKLQSAPSGTLKISCPMSFGILHISPAITDFLALYPDLHINMFLDDRKVDIVEEGFDLAIRIADLMDSSLIARKLAPCPHVVCASKAYLEEKGRPTVPGDLQRHNILMYQYKNSPDEWQFSTTDGSLETVRVTGNIQMNNSLALREILLNDGGIMMTPSFMVGADIQSGKVEKLLAEYRIKEMSIYAVYPAKRYLSPKISVFIDFLKKRFKEQPYWD